MTQAFDSTLNALCSVIKVFFLKNGGKHSNSCTHQIFWSQLLGIFGWFTVYLEMQSIPGLLEF
jgi:hypothetical protein